jgi:ribosomal protein L30E
LENKSKAETFIGFAIRTGKFRIGTNAVQTLKRAYLMIVCSSASQNTKEQAEKIAKKFHCQLIETVSTTLEQLTHRENAKVMAIADKNLSVAILENMEKDFIARI